MKKLRYVTRIINTYKVKFKLYYSTKLLKKWKICVWCSNIQWIQISIIKHNRQIQVICCVWYIIISFTIIFKIKYSLINIVYELCTINSFNLQNFHQNFLHRQYYTFNGARSTWSLKSNPALGKLLFGKHFTRGYVRVFDFTHNYLSVSI